MPIKITSAQGIQGIQGIQGVQGVQGIQGIQNSRPKTPTTIKASKKPLTATIDSQGKTNPNLIQ